MLTAITRYGVRIPPHTDEIIERCMSRGEVTDGPLIAEFERAPREFGARVQKTFAGLGTSAGELVAALENVAQLHRELVDRDAVTLLQHVDTDDVTVDRTDT